MKIGSMSPAKRCAVCHQEDSLDPTTGACARCAQAGIKVSNIEVDLAAPILEEISLKEESQYKARIARAEALIIERLIAYVGEGGISEHDLKAYDSSKLIECYRHLLRRERAHKKRSSIAVVTLFLIAIGALAIDNLLVAVFFSNVLRFGLFVLLVFAWLSLYKRASDASIEARALIQAHELLQDTYSHGYVYKLFHKEGEKG